MKIKFAMSLAVIIIVLSYGYVKTISEDFSAIDGINAMTRLFIGTEVVELTSYEGHPLIMVKSGESGTNSFIDHAKNQGYHYQEQLGSAWAFDKDGERIFIESEMYSSHYMIFHLPN